MWIRITGVKCGLKEKDFLILRRRKKILNFFYLFYQHFSEKFSSIFAFLIQIRILNADTDPDPNHSPAVLNYFSRYFPLFVCKGL